MLDSKHVRAKKKKPTDALVRRYRAALADLTREPEAEKVMSDKGALSALLACWHQRRSAYLEQYDRKGDKRVMASAPYPLPTRVVCPLVRLYLRPYLKNRYGLLRQQLLHDQARALEQYQLAQKVRKQDPDVKEALARGRDFRWNMVKRVRRQYLKAAAPLRDAMDLINRGGWGRIEQEANLLSDRLTKLHHRHERAPEAIKSLRLQYVPVKCRGLSEKVRRQIREQIGGRALERASWGFRYHHDNEVLHHQYHETSWDRGRPRTAQHSSHVIGYRSFCVVSPDGATLTRVGPMDPPVQESLQLPRGFRWDQDDLGIRIVRERDQADYHPGDFSKSWDDQTVSTWIGYLVLQAVQRAEMERRELESRLDADHFLRDLPTTRVTLRDSKLAGNCLEGSLAFAVRNLRMSRKDLLGVITDDGQVREMTEGEIMHSLYLHTVPATRLYDTHDSRAIRACRVAWGRETLVCI